MPGLQWNSARRSVFLFGVFADDRDVPLDSVEVGVGTVRVGHRKKTVNFPEFRIEARTDHLGPEIGRLEDQVLRRLEATAVAGHRHEVVGLVKFAEEYLELLRIIRGGHLAEQIGGGEGAADEAINRMVKLQAANLVVGSGAVDRAQHAGDFVFVDSQRGQVGSGEGAAAQDVGQGVFGASAIRVRPRLEVAGVVQERCSDREFELTGRKRLDLTGALGTLEQHRDADDGLQRMLEVVIPQVDCLVIRVFSREKQLNPVESRFEQSGHGPGEQALESLTGQSGHGSGILGVDGGEHAGKAG